MAEVLAREQPGAVLMHTRGAPRVWASLPALPHAEVVPLVVSGLAHSLQLAEAAGIAEEQIMIDPGFGFGKIGDENFTLLAHVAALQQFERPVLVGVSRKRFLTAWQKQTTADPESLRANATAAANTAAVLGGAHVLRVHDVAAARAAVQVADSMLQAWRDEEPVGFGAG